MRLLPRAFDVVGDVAVLLIEDRIARHATAIARAIVRWNPAIKRVVRDEGVEGELRIRGVRPLIGNSLLTEHRENGLRLMVDLSSVYFSPRLAGERARVASLVGNGERVLDMFAGVGPFSVLIAKTRPDSEVVAVDANPAAVALLEENAALNKVNIKVIPGRAEEVGEGSGHFDRIIMNLPRSGERFLALAFSLLPERGGTIHHYAVLSPEELPPRIVLIESEAARAGFAAKCGPRRLRNFGVGVWIYAIDVVAARL
jgi:tRNA (guanine37-N1)-methyltransferase